MIMNLNDLSITKMISIRVVTGVLFMAMIMDFQRDMNKDTQMQRRIKENSIQWGAILNFFKEASLDHQFKLKSCRGNHSQSLQIILEYPSNIKVSIKIF